MMLINALASVTRLEFFTEKLAIWAFCYKAGISYVRYHISYVTCIIIRYNLYLVVVSHGSGRHPPYNI